MRWPIVTESHRFAGKLSTCASVTTDWTHNQGVPLSDSPDQTPDAAAAAAPESEQSSGDIGRFLTLADTAEILNISASEAYALVRTAELPAIKIGSRGQWRVERTVLESYIAAKYEETRRMGLWNQADYASLAEYSFDPQRRGPVD